MREVSASVTTLSPGVNRADSAAQVDKEVCEIIRSAHQKALQILRDNRDVMDKLAAYLLEKETITGEEFMEILKQCDAQK